MSVIDLKKREIVRQYGTRRLRGRQHGFQEPLNHPGRQVPLLRGDGETSKVRASGRTRSNTRSRASGSAQNGQSIVISPDGYYVALPSGGGNYGEKPYSTRVYEITDLSKPAIVLHSGALPGDPRVRHESRSDVRTKL